MTNVYAFTYRCIPRTMSTTITAISSYSGLAGVVSSLKSQSILYRLVKPHKSPYSQTPFLDQRVFTSIWWFSLLPGGWYPDTVAPLRLVPDPIHHFWCPILMGHFILKSIFSILSGLSASLSASPFLHYINIFFFWKIKVILKKNAK